MGTDLVPSPAGHVASVTPMAAPPGVLVGNAFNTTPFPPPADLLGRALKVPGLPLHKGPRETFGERLQRAMNRWGLPVGDERARLRWKVRDATASAIASVLSQPPGGQRHTGEFPIVSVRHPYHLRAAFDLLPLLPDDLAADRRFLELIFVRILRSYGEQISLARGMPFSFEAEAREFFVSGIKIERQIKRIDNEREYAGAIQMLNDSYYHGRYYYYFSLLRRERPDPESRLHLLYARASFFLARIDWQGKIQPRANLRALPSRATIQFLLHRDRSVTERYRADPAFRDQINRLIHSFPKR